MDAGLDDLQARPKNLPPLGLAKGDDLPLPPVSPIGSMHRPSPPPKGVFNGMNGQPPTYAARGEHPLPSPASELPPTPAFMASPPGSPRSFQGSSFSHGSPSLGPADSARPKKVNTFVDLLDTERIYVDILSGIIRKVAAAWSRSNLPPPELDTMFRSVEGIFKANRSFQTKLKEIGPSPSSPRAIGDLLMGWVDQLDVPYSKYCTSFVGGFDVWEPVQSNRRLQGVLIAFSESAPPPHAPVWTLDALFALPQQRIKYYLKLYGRLLKNSAPGKSTDKKLVEAVERLESLLSVVEDRRNVQLPGPSQAFESQDEVVIDTRSLEGEVQQMNLASPIERERNEAGLHPVIRDSGGSITSSAPRSSTSSALRSSRDTTATSEGHASFSTSPSSVAELEASLCTDRCKDLFTMQLRNVKLSINSQNLPFTREIALSEDTEIHFTPQSTGIGVIHRRGHIYLLTDLFLISERMSSDERARSDPNHEMWLCYPPLAVKHVRPEPCGDSNIEITILKKERMLLCFESPSRRDEVLRKFRSTVDRAAALAPQSKNPPPPVPPLPNASQSQSHSRSNSPRRSLSSSQDGHQPGPPPYTLTNEQNPGMNGQRPPEQQMMGAGQFRPPPRGESSRGPAGPQGPAGLPSRPNMAQPPTSFQPGQVIPPQRSGSNASQYSQHSQHSQQRFMGGLPPSRNAMSPPPANGWNDMPQGMVAPQPMNGGPGMGPYRTGSMGAPRPPHGGPPFGPGQGMPGGPMHPHHSMGGSAPQSPNMGQQPMAPFAAPPRPNSDPSFQGGLRKTPSLHSLHAPQAQFVPPRSAPPVPNMPPQNYPQNYPPRGPGMGFGPGPGQGIPGRTGSMMSDNNGRPMLPSAALPRVASSAPAFGGDDSPPPSPTDKGPVSSASILGPVKCKVFLQQQHAQWKALGSSKLMLYEQRPTMIKQLVVEADNKDKPVLMSTIVLSDGVERVGKTGVAIKLSDNGVRTGIVYMVQLRNEKDTSRFYEQLLMGSDRRG